MSSKATWDAAAEHEQKQRLARSVLIGLRDSLLAADVEVGRPRHNGSLIAITADGRSLYLTVVPGGIRCELLDANGLTLADVLEGTESEALAFVRWHNAANTGAR